MLNQYPWWKYLIIALVVVPGLFYALPNLFGDDPGIQIRGNRGNHVDTELMEQITQTLSVAGITAKSAVLEEDSIRIRLNSADDQLKARDLIRGELANSYTAALTLLPATPGWLKSLNAQPMYLGLDLRGGVHFLMEVDMDSALTRAQDRYVSDIKSNLREASLRYRSVRRREDGAIEVRMRDPGQLAEAEDLIERQLGGLLVEEQGEDGSLQIRLSESEEASLREFALQQNITALRNRINELGVAEPVVQKQGDRRIVIQLPGVQDTARRQGNSGTHRHP